MANDRDPRTNGLARDFSAALDDLHDCLRRADKAAEALRDMLGQIDAVGGVFDDVEATLRAGRERLTAAHPAFAGGRASGYDAAQTEAAATFVAEVAPSANRTKTLRVEIQSAPGRLDLRAIDDAIARNPSVRDVALLDYDGHRAMLRLWVDRGTSPDDVQSALIGSGNLPEGHELTVITLDEVA